MNGVKEAKAKLLEKLAHLKKQKEQLDQEKRIAEKEYNTKLFQALGTYYPNSFAETETAESIYYFAIERDFDPKELYSRLYRINNAICGGWTTLELLYPNPETSSEYLQNAIFVYANDLVDYKFRGFSALKAEELFLKAFEKAKKENSEHIVVYEWLVKGFTLFGKNSEKHFWDHY